MDVTKPTDPARQPLIDRVRLEAQRRSARYYLSEYLTIRARLLSRRRGFMSIPDPRYNFPDEDWICSLVKDIKPAESGGPGK